MFLVWILGKASQAELDGTATGRSFRRAVSWCWNVTVQAPQTGQVHDAIMLDGTYFNGWCVLVAYTHDQVVDWQWCDKESQAAYGALLGRIAPPRVVIVDGHKALMAAVKEHWPNTRVQRCLFHIRQGAHRHLTRHPRLPAAQELLALIVAIPKVKDLDEAAGWVAAYLSWDARWAPFLKERSYAKHGAIRPTYVRAGQKWWFTHIRLRRARSLINGALMPGGISPKNLEYGHLFTWLAHPAPPPDPAIQPAPKRTTGRTTSPLEGAVNKAIKDLLRHHRGLPPHHARKVVDWYLYHQIKDIKDPWTLVKEHHHNPAKQKPKPVLEEQQGPAEYDTAFSTEEGIGIRKGWAGRY